MALLASTSSNSSRDTKYSWRKFDLKKGRESGIVKLKLTCHLAWETQKQEDHRVFHASQKLHSKLLSQQQNKNERHKIEERMEETWEEERSKRPFLHHWEEMAKTEAKLAQRLESFSQESTALACNPTAGAPQANCFLFLAFSFPPMHWKTTESPLVHKFCYSRARNRNGKRLRQTGAPAAGRHPATAVLCSPWGFASTVSLLEAARQLRSWF